MNLLFLISELIRVLQAIRDNAWAPSALLLKVWSIVDQQHQGHLGTCEEMKDLSSQSRLDESESDSKEVPRWGAEARLKFPPLSFINHPSTLVHHVQGQTLGP